jgi:pyruvate-formate lyase-activating enzyme
MRIPLESFDTTEHLTAVVANPNGDIFELEGYAATGSDGPLHMPLTAADTVALPHGSELMYLPQRMPILYNLDAQCLQTLPENPYVPGEPIFPVAAFNSPGFMLSHTCAYTERENAAALPLFSYGAVGWRDGHFRSAAIRVDHEPRQDLRRMPMQKVRTGVRNLRRAMPRNRLRAHLEHCALVYGCPAGKNFFLGRYEAPLPTATACNARCLGCISLQPGGDIPCSQERIRFTPSADEIAEVALAHIERVTHAVVSFGQGCEGDPLTAAETITKAIAKIRSATDRGTINMNTNGSMPQVIQRLLDAGLDSLRISLNSVRKALYTAYFRPKTYTFEDVIASIDRALDRGAHVAINYLNCPGVTDTPEESGALLSLLKDHPLHMIQWRNLNFDPLRYVQMMNDVAEHGLPTGVANLLAAVRRHAPHVRYGYFNPPKEHFSQAPSTPGGPNGRMGSRTDGSIGKERDNL